MPLFDWMLCCVFGKYLIMQTTQYQIHKLVLFFLDETKKQELLELSRETKLIDIQRPLDQCYRVDLY